MTTASADGVPVDSFAVRLAIVRAVMGWNYDQASRATGIGSETWRMWEKGKRRCTDVLGVGSQLAAATGLSREWIVLGGPLAMDGLSSVTKRYLRSTVSHTRIRHDLPGSGIGHSRRGRSVDRLERINRHHTVTNLCRSVAA